MATRSLGPGAGIAWLVEGLRVGRGNRKALVGGAALMLVASLLPSLITMPMQMAMEPSVGVMVAILAVSMIAGVLLVPLFGGYLMMIHDAEQGRPVRAMDVFAAYRPGGGGVRMLGLGLGMLVCYAVALGVLLLTAGRGLVSFYIQALQSAGTGTQPVVSPDLPQSLFVFFLAAAVLWMIVMGVYSISFGQVAIARKAVLSSMTDGLVGSLKNLLPSLVMTVAGLTAGLALAVVVGIAIALLAGLASLVSPILAVVLIAPVYLALLLAMYVYMFGVMYVMWRDICEEAPGAPAIEGATVAA